MKLLTNQIVMLFIVLSVSNINSPIIAQTVNATATQEDGNYIYAPPIGWTTTRYPDGVVLRSPTFSTGEQCLLTLWPMGASSGNLLQDANNAFNKVYNEYTITNSSTPASIIKGISPQGWDYCIIKNPITLRGGNYATLFGFVFVAKLGNELASISGLSKDPLVSSCFGLQLTDVWPKFFYSLKFKSWNASGNGAELARRLAGVWMAVTATAGDRFAFAANGRYAGAAAAQRYYRVSSTELSRVTDAYFGDGSYSVSGNVIVLTPDNDKAHPQQCLFRIEQESKDGGKTWNEKLYLLRKSVVDGTEYEVEYEKQNN